MSDLQVLSQAKQPTRRQSIFLNALIADPKQNATQAAIEAGCPAKNAKIAACKWLKMPHIAAEYDRRRIELLEQLGVNRHTVLSETAAVAHSNVLDFLPALQSGDLSKLTRQQAAAIKELTIEEFEDPAPKPEAKPEGATLEAQPQGGALMRGSNKRKPRLRRRIHLKLLPKTPALELLGKNLNLWSDKQDGEGAGNNVQVNVIFDM